MPGARAFAAGRFLLELDGVKCGFLRSVDGGNVKGEVVHEARSRGPFVKKRLGSTQIEPLVLELGLGLDKALYAWMAEAASGKQTPRNGAIVAADASLAAKERRDFSEALIAELSFPAADASAKDAAFMIVKVAPNAVQAKKASGKLQAPAGKAKSWLPSNFRLEIDGLDCKKVSKIDAFTVQCAPPLDFPDLRITLAESSAQTWLAWHQSFVLDGKSSDAEEKSGRLVFLAPNLKDVLGEIRLFGLGIYGLAAARQASASAIKRLVAELYCERMELSLT